MNKPKETWKEYAERRGAVPFTGRGYGEPVISFGAGRATDRDSGEKLLAITINGHVFVDTYEGFADMLTKIGKIILNLGQEDAE